MLLGYNTNGFAHHSVEDALAILAEIGYRSVALTIDHAMLNPYGGELSAQLRRMRQLLTRYEMRSVIETGARFLLDPRQKHEPTLVSADAAERSRRVRFLQQTIDIAAELQSDCVSFWSGVLHEPGVSEAAAFDRLCAGLLQVIEYAQSRNVQLGFEPEPGMFIDTMVRYEQLLQRVDAPCFKLTLDIGHLHCRGETPIAEHIRRWAPRLVNVHIEDMKCGVHEHLMFGEGEINFLPVMQALRDSNYAGGVHVELSRHSHMAPEAARRAYDFLEPLIK
ncbi:MAG: sugar phosphate isomerase/epimerase family protein [Pirellulales bacterium]